MQRRRHFGDSAQQVILMLAGIALIAGVTSLLHGH
jgi:hypothetical protein